MKKFSFFVLLLTLCLAPAFSYLYVADKNPAKQNTLMWTPDDAKVKTLDKHTIEVTGGNDYEYIAISESGQLLPPVKSAKISCTCTAGSGCNPFSGHGQKGCAMDGCTACSGTVSIKSLTAAGHAEVTVSNGGFALKKVKVEFATIAEAKKGATVFQALLQTEKAQQAINQFKAKFSSLTSAEKVFTLVSIAGRIGVMEVPKKFANDNKGIILAGKGTCSCTEGTCSYSSSYGVEGCTGSCTGTCSLTTAVKATGKEMTIESFSW